MNSSLAASLFLDTHQRQFKWYWLGVLIGYAALLLFAILIERTELIATCVLAPAALVIVAFPRVVLTLFIATMFVHIQVIPGSTLLLSDCSSLLVISAALVDLLVSKSLPRSFPRLTFHFIILLVVVFAAALASSRPELGLSSFLRLALLTAVFFSVYRLTGKTGFAFPVKAFFWVCALFALPAIYGFLATGGVSRSFGFTPQVMDDFTMLSLPLGLSLFLFSKQVRALWYLVGTALVGAGLLATQSRLSIFLALLHSSLLLFFVWRQFRNSQTPTTDAPIKKRLGVLIGTVLGMGVLLLIAKPELFLGVFERFDVAFGGGRMGESYVPRLALWTAAFRAFLDHPLLGIGPGNFRAIIDLYPELSLNYYFFWVRGASSHNLFLHYLAETGLVGASTVLALFITGFCYSWQSWKKYRTTDLAGESLGILIVACIFVVTAFVEAGWMWAQTGFAMAIFMGAIARQRDNLN